MSNLVTKVAVRMEVLQLKGASQEDALQLFTEKLGEPEEIDRFDGVLLGFSCGNRSGIVPVYRDKRWGIEVVVKQDMTSVFGDVAVGFDELVSTVKRLITVFPEPEELGDPVLTAAVFYDTNNEPVRFEPRASVVYQAEVSADA